ncbi:MAG: PaaX family transcriptional regulator [Myxococcota bacterium]|nr:PaaX family transcriptional regulator [Myxococcota bacterium]
MKISPKSLILDLLSTLRPGRGRSMPVRALVEAGAFFDMAPTSVRVALARLLAQQRVERDERGRYRLGVAAHGVNQTIRGWRHLEAQSVAWSGGWVGVHRKRGESRVDRLSGDRALNFLGLRALDANFFVRPDNRAGGIHSLRGRLAALGLEASALVFGLAQLDSATEARASNLWDVSALRRGYGDEIERLSRSRRRLANSANPRAMVETFRVGGQAIRQLVLDPLLPEAISPSEERKALAACMLDYDAFGRGCWAEFLAEHGVLHPRTPADLRGAAGSESLALMPESAALGNLDLAGAAAE